MKHWLISTTSATDQHLIVTETAIWLSEQQRGANIDELISTKGLGTVKSIRYENLKEIAFVDTDYTLELNYIDDNTTDEKFKLNQQVYFEIRTYLKSNLKGIHIKNYSVSRQIVPHLVVTGMTGILTTLIYLSAKDLEAGGTINTNGKRGLFRKIIGEIALVLGSTGTLIFGTSIIVIALFLLIKKIQSPKKGEVLSLLHNAKVSL